MVIATAVLNRAFLLHQRKSPAEAGLFQQKIALR